MAERKLYLTLLRHAKAGNQGPEGTDFDRPLTARGVHDAARMAELIASQLPPVDLAMVSSARRAKLSGEIVASVLALPPGALLLEERLYMAEPEQILYRIRELPAELNHLLLVAHNPAIQEAASMLAKEELGPVPTAGMVTFEIDASSWASLSPDTARLSGVYRPKELRA